MAFSRIDPLVATMVLYFGATILIAWWSGRDADAGYVKFKLVNIPGYEFVHKLELLGFLRIAYRVISFQLIFG